MNTTVWSARLLGIGGVLETGAGLGLLVAPSALSNILLQSPLSGPGVVVGRIAGGGLLGLGIACWCARTTPLSPAGRGAAWGLLGYNLVACVTLACAGAASVGAAPGGGGLVALAAAALHGVLGAGLLFALARRDQSSTTP